jgi:Leucine-rich repeat (LRR) protein
MVCNMYKLAPNLSALHYDQLNGNKLGIDLNAQSQANQNAVKNSSLGTNSGAPVGTNNAKASASTNLDQPSNKKISEINVAAMLDNANTNAGPSANLLSTIDDHFYFDFNEKDEQILDIIASNTAAGDEEQYVMVDCYERMLDNLQVVNLSNNNLTKIPPFIYKLKNLKQIYFNGNLLKRIPNELYKKPQSLEDEIIFERLKQQQLAKIKEEQKRKRIENGEEEEEEEEPEDADEEEENTKKKKNKKKTKKELEKEKQEAAAEEERRRKEAEALLQKDVKLVSDSLEVIHLNNNQIEYVPDSLFSNFKRLKEIKLVSNPLRDPPQESVCISAKLTSRNNQFKSASFGGKSESVEATTTSITKLENPTTAGNNKLANIQAPYLNNASLNLKQLDSKGLAKDDKEFKEEVQPSLPNLFFETNDYLKPLQSYMTKYKSREGIFLVFACFNRIIAFQIIN